MKLIVAALDDECHGFYKKQAENYNKAPVQEKTTGFVIRHADVIFAVAVDENIGPDRTFQFVLNVVPGVLRKYGSMMADTPVVIPRNHRSTLPRQWIKVIGPTGTVIPDDAPTSQLMCGDLSRSWTSIEVWSLRSWASTFSPDLLKALDDVETKANASAKGKEAAAPASASASAATATAKLS